MLVKKHFSIFLLIFLGCSVQEMVHAQCTTPINSFPYNENFEASDGNWVRSSVAHWEWGQINTKPVITTAGSGLKCWIVGGYSGSQYNSGSSYVQSPCFDISSLSNPQISFKVFWETERRYDGVTMQYSLDGGIAWLNLGAANSNDGCSIQNWFNYDPIFTSGLPGWSGNIQSTSGSCQGTGGSGQWVTATHTLSSIAGATGVIFRFTFSAGTTCNGFDGFAFDDVEIGEAPVNGSNYTYTCGGSQTIDFTSLISGCITSVSWDFGDVASGANNSSTILNPTHTFSSTGSYTVVLTANFVTGPSLGVAKTINVISVTSAITGTLKCYGSQTAAITVTVNPAGTYTYSWDTNPVQTTPSISGLGIGTYTVTVSGANACATSLPVIITGPEPLVINGAVVYAICGGSNGSATADPTGGTSPYNYTWSTGEHTQTINNLAPGNYSVTVTDANGCSRFSNNFDVLDRVDPIPVSLGNDTSICAGQKLILNPGSFSSYLWQDNSSAPIFTVSSPGTYSVTISNGTGCTGTASIKIAAGCLEIFFPSAFTPNNDGRNESFGPLPLVNLSSIKNYKLTVFGRWGEVIFTTKDPYTRWDGTYKGKPLPAQVFTWTVSYIQNNLLQEFKSGTVSIVR